MIRKAMVMMTKMLLMLVVTLTVMMSELPQWRLPSCVDDDSAGGDEHVDGQYVHFDDRELPID